MSLMVEQQQRTQLNDLVRTRRAELGITLRTLEAQAIDPRTGTQAKFGWISKLERNQPTGVPSEELMRALAAGLSLPLRVIQEAVAAQYLGMTEVRTSSRAARILVARVEEMSEDDLQQLAEIAETFERSRRRGNS